MRTPLRIPHHLVSAIGVATLAIVGAACGDDAGDATPSTTAVPTTTVPNSNASNSNASTTTTAGSALPDLSSLEPGPTCGDAFFHLVTADGRAVVQIHVPEVVDLGDGGTPIDHTARIGDGATATLEIGTALGDAACNDVISGDYAVDRTIDAEEGMVIVLAEPAADASVFDAQADVSGLTFEIDGETVVLDEASITGAIGWLPG